MQYRLVGILLLTISFDYIVARQDLPVQGISHASELFLAKITEPDRDRDAERDELEALSVHGENLETLKTQKYSSDTSREFKAAVVEESRADIERFQARVSINEAFWQKAKAEEKYLLRKVQRAQQLYERSAVSEEELDDAKSDYEQNLINQKVLLAFIEEEKARVKAAEGRLKQALASEKMSN